MTSVFVGTRVTLGMKSLSLKNENGLRGRELSHYYHLKEKERSTGCGVCWRVSLKKLSVHRVIFLAERLKFVCLRTIGQDDESAQETSVM